MIGSTISILLDIKFAQDESQHISGFSFSAAIRLEIGRFV